MAPIIRKGQINGGGWRGSPEIEVEAAMPKNCSREHEFIAQHRLTACGKHRHNPITPCYAGLNPLSEDPRQEGFRAKYRGSHVSQEHSVDIWETAPRRGGWLGYCKRRILRLP